VRSGPNPAAFDVDFPVTADTGDDGRFTAVVAAVTRAFGDPTRRDIFLFVRAHPESSAADVASAFSVHPNVARHHLARLVDGGYLQVVLGPRQGAGRPSQR
jgi:DNA-binding transcriptional ArsR family regulator